MVILCRSYYYGDSKLKPKVRAMTYIDLGFIIFAYLIGSISSAIVVCKLMHLPDPRTSGSSNPGATNVLRIAGKFPALLTLLGDVLKGTIPVAIFLYFYHAPIIAALIALAAIIGHLYPIFFRFQGGKGVATALGCLLALSLPVAGLWLLTWLVIAAIFRYSSLAALVAMLLTPAYFWFMQKPSAYIYWALLVALLLLWRHRKNLQNLWQGKEKKIGQRS